VTSYDKAEKHNMTGEDTAVDDGALDSVFATDRDRGGKTAPPEPAPKETVSTEPAAEKPAEGEEADPKRDPFEKYRDPESGRLVSEAERKGLLNELKSEREKRQEQARLREESDKRSKEYEERIKDYERRLQAAQQPPLQHQQPVQQQPQPKRPDVWTDPEGALAYDRQQLEAKQKFDIFETRLEFSEELMSAKPDYEQMKAIFLEAANANPALAQQMVSHRMPAKFVYEEGKRLAAYKEVGTDLEGYRKRIEDEARVKFLEELKTGTTATAQPQKFPGTLADATASGGQGAHLTDEAVMGDVFSTNRRRK
jgi:hypothetical protein